MRTLHKLCLAVLWLGSAEVSHATMLPVTGANLVLHLDASAINPLDTNQVAAANKMVNWLDQSSQGNDAGQKLAQYRPTYVSNGGTAFNNKPVIQFAGASQNFLDIGNTTYSYNSGVGGLTNQSGATVFVVFDTTTNPATNQVALEAITSASQPSFPRTQVNASKFYTGTNPNAYAIGNTTVVQNTPYLYSSIFDGSQVDFGKLSLHINGVAETLSGQTGTPLGNTGSVDRVLVGNWQTGTFGLTGNIAEIVIYNRVLSAAEYNQVGYALAQTYNLTTAFVPEPSSLSMLLFGSVMLWLVRRKRS